MLFILFLLITLSSCSNGTGTNINNPLPKNQDGYVEFQPAIQSGKMVIAKFGLEICTGCIEANKILISLMPTYDKSIYFSKVDLMEDREAEKKYNITMMPTIIFFDKGGKEFQRIEGQITKEDIVKVLDSICWSY
jgi:thiol-disulfide isomerase/thioredoxin